MSEQNNLLQLKKLASKMTGTSEDKIKAETIADVLDIIQQNYSSGGGGGGVTIEKVTLNSNGSGLVKGGEIVMSNGDVIEMILTSVETLTVTSVEGSAINKTKITVSPQLTSGNKYRYSLNTSVIPAYHEDLSSWLEWDGASEIEASDGETIMIAECTSDNKVLSAGKTTVHAPIF